MVLSIKVFTSKLQRITRRLSSSWLLCQREELASERIEQKKAVGDRATCYCDSEACAER